MILGIDGNEANVSERVGVSWYVYHVLHELSTAASRDISIRVFLREPPRDDLPKASPYLTYHVVEGKRLWSQLFLPLALLLRHRDLSVFVAPAHYAPRISPCPTVVVINDVSYRYYPADFRPQDLYQLQSWTGYSVKHAHTVIAVSQQTREDVIAHYHVPPDRTRVVYNGFSPPKGINQKNDGTDKSILYIGTLQPRKNLETLLEAFALFHTDHPDYRLIIAGKKGWMYESIFAQAQRYTIGRAVQFVGYLQETEKYEYLSHAAALVMPGYYEGFGLPMLEAFWMGVPVLAASTGSLPEIGATACAYADPANGKAMADTLRLIIDNKSLRTELIDLGLKRVADFNWKKTTRELIDACSQVR